MNNIYYRDLINILLPHGSSGMELRRIAQRIFNIHTNLFDDTINYDVIHRQVGMYLWRQSRKPDSPFQHNSYGVYSIKRDMAIQLDLFWDLSPTDELAAPEQKKMRECCNHIQLNLFEQA